MQKTEAFLHFECNGWVAVSKELTRQENLRLSGKFEETVVDVARRGDRLKALSIIAEEFGEIARAINDGDDENLIEELHQTAACCVGMAIGLQLLKVGE